MQSPAECKVWENPGLTSAAEKPNCQVTLGSVYTHITRVSSHQLLLRANRVKMQVALSEDPRRSS